MLSATTAVSACGGGSTTASSTTTTSSRIALADSPSDEPVAKVLAGDTYRPSSGWCFNTNNCFKSLSWEIYGAAEAKGTGTLASCPPSAQESSCSIGRVTISLSSPAQVADALRFRALAIHGGGTSWNFGINRYRPDSYDGVVMLLNLGGSAPSIKPAPSAAVLDCNETVTISGSAGIFITSAAGLSCTEAAADIRTAASRSTPPFKTSGGYTCDMVGDYQEGSNFRCVNGSNAYRYSEGS